MSQSCYVRLSEESVAEFNVAGHKLWFDESAQALVLLRKGEFRAISLITVDARKHGEVFLRFKCDTSTLDVKISPCNQFVAIQKSDHEVIVVSISPETTSVSSSSSAKIESKKSGNIILRGGVIWIPSPTPRLLLVTMNGLESYSMVHISKWIHMGTFPLFRVRCFWSLYSMRLLVVQTDEGEMCPFQLDSNLTRWAKFSVTDDGGPSPDQGDAALVELYANTWFVHVRPGGDLILYKLTKDKTVRTKTLKSFEGVTCGISVIDSVLITHSQQLHVSLLFDVLDEDTTRCFTMPMPLSAGNDTATSYPNSWVFLPPHWVLDARLGRVWKLELCLSNIGKDSTSLPGDRYCRFLLRRMSGHLTQEAKTCLFDDKLLSDPSMKAVSATLPYLKELAEHEALISPLEVYQRYFSKISALADGRNATLVLEYARMLGTASSSPLLLSQQKEIFVHMVRTLLLSKRFAELYQMCLLHIFPADDGDVWELMISNKEFASSAPERKQVVMDALSRLKDRRIELIVALVETEEEDDSFIQGIGLLDSVLLEDADMVERLFVSSKGNLDRQCLLANLLEEKCPTWLDGIQLPNRIPQIHLLVLESMKSAFGLLGVS